MMRTVTTTHEGTRRHITIHFTHITSLSAELVEVDRHVLEEQPGVTTVLLAHLAPRLGRHAAVVGGDEAEGHRPRLPVDCDGAKLGNATLSSLHDRLRARAATRQEGHGDQGQAEAADRHGPGAGQRLTAQPGAERS